MSIYNIASRTTISALLVVGFGVSGSLGAPSSLAVHGLLNSAVLQKVKGSIEANPYAAIALTGTAAVGLTAACILGAQRWAGKNEPHVSSVPFVLVVKESKLTEEKKAAIINGLCGASIGDIDSAKKKFEEICKRLCGDAFDHTYTDPSKRYLNFNGPRDGKGVAFLFIHYADVKWQDVRTIRLVDYALESAPFRLDQRMPMDGTVMDKLTLVPSKKMLDDMEQQAKNALEQATQQLKENDTLIKELNSQCDDQNRALEKAKQETSQALKAKENLEKSLEQLKKEHQILTEQKTSSEDKAVTFAAQVKELQEKAATINKSNNTLLNELFGLALWREYSSAHIQPVIQEARREGFAGLKKLFEFLHTYKVTSSTAHAQALVVLQQQLKKTQQDLEAASVQLQEKDEQLATTQKTVQHIQGLLDAQNAAVLANTTAFNELLELPLWKKYPDAIRMVMRNQIQMDGIRSLKNFFDFLHNYNQGLDEKIQKIMDKYGIRSEGGPHRFFDIDTFIKTQMDEVNNLKNRVRDLQKQIPVSRNTTQNSTNERAIFLCTQEDWEKQPFKQQDATASTLETSGGDQKQ